MIDLCSQYYVKFLELFKFKLDTQTGPYNMKLLSYFLTRQKTHCFFKITIREIKDAIEYGIVRAWIGKIFQFS